MEINERIKALLNEEVHEEGLAIVYDGLVNEITYTQGDRLLFLLKDVTSIQTREPNNKTTCISSIAEIDQFATQPLPKGASGNLKTLCSWIEAYKNPNKSYRDTDGCERNTCELGVILVNKAADTARTGTAELGLWEARYGHVIRKEIDMINPAVVICCGTFKCAKKIFKTKHATTSIMALDSGANCFQVNDHLFVDFVDPDARVCKAAPYAYAKEVFREIKQFFT